MINLIKFLFQNFLREFFLNLGLGYSFCDFVKIFFSIFFTQYGLLLFNLGWIFKCVVKVLWVVLFDDWMDIGVGLLNAWYDGILKFFVIVSFLGQNLIMMRTVSLLDSGQFDILFILMAIALPSSKMFDSYSLVKGRLDIQVLAEWLMTGLGFGDFIGITTEPEVTFWVWFIVVFVCISAKICWYDLRLFALLYKLLKIVTGDFRQIWRRQIW